MLWLPLINACVANVVAVDAGNWINKIIISVVVAVDQCMCGQCCCRRCQRLKEQNNNLCCGCRWLMPLWPMLLPQWKEWISSSVVVAVNQCWRGQCWCRRCWHWRNKIIMVCCGCHWLMQASNVAISAGVVRCQRLNKEWSSAKVILRCWRSLLTWSKFPPPQWLQGVVGHNSKLLGSHSRGGRYGHHGYWPVFMLRMYTAGEK